MEEEAEEEEAPEAGEDAVIRGAVAYYTKRNESVDEIARERGLDSAILSLGIRRNIQIFHASRNF